jgi:hypothetical protein
MIQHDSFVSLYQKDQDIYNKVFTDVKKLSELSSRIKKISKDYVKLSYKSDDKVKGDLFEIFAECFFKVLPVSPTKNGGYGVYGYTPEKPENDNGVDGFGIGMDEKPLTVQVKFRSNPTEELKEEDIKQFAYQSIINYDVDKDTTTNMILFTNAPGLHWYTDTKVFAGRVKALGGKEISSLIDNNTIFWKLLRDMIEETIKNRF